MEEEWSPDSKLTFTHHMIAGSLAGLAEHITTFPIDTLKTFVQCERCGTSSWKCAVEIIRREGLFRLWRGVTATFAGCIPAHAAYFSVYEGMKVAVGADKPGHHPLQAALCGSMAAFSHDMFMTPMDTVKQRMQLGYYKNVFHCIRTVIRTEGVRSLYASFPTTVVMNLPYGAIMLATNESMKKILNPSDEYSIPASMASGSIAGLVAAAFTNPLDVIKTRLQTRSLGSCPVEMSAAVPITAVRAGHTTPLSSSSTTISYLSSSLNSSTIKSSSLESPIVYTKSSSSSSSTATAASTSHRNAFTELLVETRQVARSIIKQDRYAGFWRGVGPRMIVHAPSVAISWTVYEGLKDALSSDTDTTGSR